MIRHSLTLLSFLALTACASAPSSEDAQMADSLATQGKALLAKGKIAEARDIYLSAASRNDQSPRVWNGLGVAYEMLGKRALAKDAYEKALELAPEDKAASNNMAHLLLTEGEADEAMHMLKTHKDDHAAPKALKQNFAKAVKEAKTGEAPETKAVQPAKATEALEAEVYADLGAAPTESMAKNRIKQIKSALGPGSAPLSFHIVPEVKVFGGTPVFNIRATGVNPESLCEELNSLAFPCFAHEDK